MSGREQDEVRAVSPTGGTKGRKPARHSLVPPTFNTALAEHYGKGEAKYPDSDGANWRKGYPWSWCIDALERHLNAFKNGEEFDEDGNLHIIAVAWHCSVLHTFTLEHPEFDDREPVVASTVQSEVQDWLAGHPVEGNLAEGSRLVPSPFLYEDGDIYTTSQGKRFKVGRTNSSTLSAPSSPVGILGEQMKLPDAFLPQNRIKLDANEGS